jgi:hypothetical protein
MAFGLTAAFKNQHAHGEYVKYVEYVEYKGTVAAIWAVGIIIFGYMIRQKLTPAFLAAL